jgi:hypothetical protein
MLLAASTYVHEDTQYLTAEYINVSDSCSQEVRI